MSNKAIARLIDIKELSRVLGITKQGISNLIKQGKFPPGVKIGGSRRWSPDDVKKYLSDSATQQIQQQKQRNQNQKNDEPQITFFEAESSSDSDSERRISEVLDSFNLAAPEANNYNSDNEIFYPSKTIVDYDVHEKITQASKDIAALSSRVIAFAGEIDSLRDSVHTLTKIVSILTNAQRNSSGLLYGQIKAALLLLTALEKEFNIDNSPAQSEDSDE